MVSMTTRRRERRILAVNAACVLVSAGWCLAAMADPGLLLPAGSTPTDGAGFYAQAYAVRQLPVSAGVLLLLGAGRRRELLPLLAVSGLAQLGDSVVGATHGNTGMAIGGGLCAAVHLASAGWLARRTRTPVAAAVAAAMT
ncbi:MAG: hypothetical protein QOF84_7247 [Streptomyces sp.]|nr:hypothetical protein [Streptomyces sp.]